MVLRACHFPGSRHQAQPRCGEGGRVFLGGRVWGGTGAGFSVCFVPWCHQGMGLGVSWCMGLGVSWDMGLGVNWCMGLGVG